MPVTPSNKKLRKYRSHDSDMCHSVIDWMKELTQIFFKNSQVNISQFCSETVNTLKSAVSVPKQRKMRSVLAGILNPHYYTNGKTALP